MCGAPEQELSTGDVGTEAVLQGTVTRGGTPLPGAYVRLLDESGEFTAEVQTSATGTFRFFAAPGTWTLRALAQGGSAERSVQAVRGQAVQTTVEVPA